LSLGRPGPLLGIDPTHKPSSIYKFYGFFFSTI